ncbi:hypothetical protein GIB67_028432, partial [Kingdonia uniflora]
LPLSSLQTHSLSLLSPSHSPLLFTLDPIFPIALRFFTELCCNPHSLSLVSYSRFPFL